MLMQQTVQFLHYLREKVLKCPPSLKLQKARNLVLRPLCFPVSDVDSVSHESYSSLTKSLMLILFLGSPGNPATPVGGCRYDSSLG